MSYHTTLSSMIFLSGWTMRRYTKVLAIRLGQPRSKCRFTNKTIHLKPGKKWSWLWGPSYGNIRSCKKMDRFTLRGQIKVNIQWLLYCLVHNIEKIANYGKTYGMATS